MSFTEGTKVVNRKIGLPFCGEVVGTVSCGRLFEGLLQGWALGLDHALDFSEWDEAVPNWRDRPVVAVRIPRTARERCRRAKGCHCETATALTHAPIDDLEAL